MGFQWPDYTLAEANVDWVPGGDDDDDNANDSDSNGDGDIASHRPSQCDVGSALNPRPWSNAQDGLTCQFGCEARCGKRTESSLQDGVTCQLARHPW